MTKTENTEERETSRMMTERRKGGKELKHYFGRHEYNMEFFMIRVESNKLTFEACIYTICYVLFSIKR